jgi:uncharacterized coiled-coil protein SlyX
MSWLFVACLIAADDGGRHPLPKPAATADVKEQKSQPPVRLRRAGKEKEGSERKAPGVSSKDTAPPKAEPTAPPPKETRKESDLDRQLLKQLGKDLEATDPEEQEAPLLRIGQRMRTVEERLARLDGSEETTAIQKKIIDDLDELLKQLQQSGQCNSQSQSKSQKKPNEPQKSQAQSKPAAGQAQPKAARPATEAGRGTAERERFAKVLEDKNVWGHLSDMLRQEMSQYAKEQFLEKYRDLLEQYYSTIAEKSRSKTE